VRLVALANKTHSPTTPILLQASHKAKRWKNTKGFSKTINLGLYNVKALGKQILQAKNGQNPRPTFSLALCFFSPLSLGNWCLDAL